MKKKVTRWEIVFPFFPGQSVRQEGIRWCKDILSRNYFAESSSGRKILFA